MLRLDFIPDFEFNMVRVAWVALFAGLLYWGNSVREAEAPALAEPMAVTAGGAR